LAFKQNSQYLKHNYKKRVVSLIRNALVILNQERVVSLNRNQVVSLSGISTLSSPCTQYCKKQAFKPTATSAQSIGHSGAIDHLVPK